MNCSCRSTDKAGAPTGSWEGIMLQANSTKNDSAASVDASQFKEDLTKLIPFLRAFARSLCSSDRETADELAQEALAKAWKSRNAFAPGTNLKAWLFTILRN